MSKNDITKDDQKTKPANDAYRDGWDRIFKKEPAVKTIKEMKHKLSNLKGEEILLKFKK